MEYPTKKCDACESTEGLVFRPVQKAQSGRYLWACSEECEHALLVQIEVAFQECEDCGGHGSFPCHSPFCPDSEHLCEDCDGDGLIEWGEDDEDDGHDRVVH